MGMKSAETFIVM